MKRLSNRSRSFVRGFFCISIMLLGLSLLPIMNTKSAISSHNLEVSFSLTPHDPISITSDSEFAVFPGSGTEEDPYVIEGYNIITTGDYGIYINDTTKSFIVRNCYVDAEDSGIYISNVADRTATVINNTCNNNRYGIWLYNSNDSNVSNNTCSNNNSHGIMLEFSESTNVISNTCSNNHYVGIKLEFSGSANVINNTCNNNSDGIAIYFSGNSTIANNILTNCGLYIGEDTIDTYLSDTVENNLVNGKKLGFYTNLDSIIISESVYGQLMLINCTNVTVRDQRLNNASVGLFLFSCTSSVIINNTCSNNSGGIFLDFSVNSTVANNTCINNYFSIYLYASNNSTVTNNTCSNNYWEGIYLYYSNSSTVVNNTCNNNRYGIYLWYSGSATVANNICSYNDLGIYLWYSGSATVTNNICSYNDIGIYLYTSSSSTVANNTCNNNDLGILLHFSDSCVVAYNLLQENGGYGLYLRYDSDNTLVYHNNFVDNNLGGTSQAYDACVNNYWYDTETSEGNYWSDYIGEGSYPIDGLSNSVDLYPLDEPVKFSTAETKMFFTFSLLIVIVPLLLLKLFSRKRRKTA